MIRKKQHYLIPLIMLCCIIYVNCDNTTNNTLSSETEISEAKSFEEFKDCCVGTIPEMDGQYIVEGDIRLRDENELRGYYRTYVQNETANTPARSIVNTVDDSIMIWTSDDARNLTYCVSDYFGSNYNTVVNALEEASQAWEEASFGAINFIHLSDEDSRCDEDNTSVMFDVYPMGYTDYYALAFFPHYQRSWRTLFIDVISFNDLPDDMTLTGLLRHELGHTLGLRHEHTRPEGVECREGNFEDSDWLELTPYDPVSVMHYPFAQSQCELAQNTELILSPHDIDGIRLLYHQGNFIVSEISGNTSENGYQAYFTIRMTNEPTDTVSLEILSSDSSEGTVSHSTVHFTPEDWNSPRNITVTGVNDDRADGDQPYTIIIGPAVSNDLRYDGIDPDDIQVINHDNGDEAGFIVGHIIGNTHENGQEASFSVRLKSQPSHPVTIGISSSDVIEGIVSHPSLTFTENNWKFFKKVTITGIDDQELDTYQVYSILLHPAVSDDEQYNGLDPEDIPTVINYALLQPMTYHIDLYLMNYNTLYATGIDRIKNNQTGFQVVDKGGWIGDVEIEGEYLYLMKKDILYASKIDGSKLTGGFQVVDQGGWSGDLEIEGNYLYLMKNDTLWAARINGNTLVKGSFRQVDQGGWYGDLEVEGNNLYLMKEDSLFVAEINGDNLVNGSFREVANQSWFGDLEVVGNNLYLMKENTLYTVEIIGNDIQWESYRQVNQGGWSGDLEFN